MSCNIGEKLLMFYEMKKKKFYDWIISILCKFYFVYNYSLKF